jgi:hypothetical protein
VPHSILRLRFHGLYNAEEAQRFPEGPRARVGAHHGSPRPPPGRITAEHPPQLPPVADIPPHGNRLMAGRKSTTRLQPKDPQGVPAKECYLLIARQL